MGCPQILILGHQAPLTITNKMFFVVVDGMLRKQKQLKNVKMMW